MTEATRTAWAGRVRQWRVSGLTAREFGAREGFNASTLRWWSSRLGREPRPTAAFVEVVLPAATPPAIELVVRDGLCIRVTRGFDSALLREVLAALEVR